MEHYFQKEIECASREEIKAIQDEKLVSQVKHVWDNVPYYRKKMEEKGLTQLAETQSKNMNAYVQNISRAKANLARFYESNDINYIEKMESRSAVCSKLRAGAAVFTVVMIAITAVLNVVM